MTDKHEAWIISTIERGLRTIYRKGFHEILRDRRLNDADKIRFLEAWVSADDFEAAEVSRALQDIKAQMGRSE